MQDPISQGGKLKYIPCHFLWIFDLEAVQTLYNCWSGEVELFYGKYSTLFSSSPPPPEGEFSQYSFGVTTKINHVLCNPVLIFK